MYIVFLTFGANKARAPALMEGHNAWLKQGFDDGVFLLAGSLKPGRGGCILAHGCPQAALRTRLEADPFVAEGVVHADIHEVDPARADARLAFLTP
jgi:uncharacterized protein YciI